MLLDTRTEHEANKTGFNPNVQNQPLTPQVKGWMWILIVLLFIFTIGLYGFAYVGKRNWLNRQQEKINTSASNIGVQLAQRRDTLTKLLDATKSHVKYEQTVLTDITELRSIDAKSIQPAQRSAIANKLDHAAIRIRAVMENYPDLKAGASIMQLMNSAEINEREIAASRRLYNQYVNDFNQAIFSFPT